MLHDTSLGQRNRFFTADTATGDPSFGYALCENEYGRYCVPDSYAHRAVPQILARGEVYEPETLHRLRSIYSGGDIVSGGAFVGDFFPALADVLGSGNKLFSFEPHPTTFAAALQTVHVNKLHNVEIAPVAVGEKPDTLPLQIARPNGKSLAAAARIVEGEDIDGKDYIIPVPITRLDDLIPGDRDVSILHLDIEGHEEPALRGAQALLNRCMPVVVLEKSRKRRQAVVDKYLSVLRELAPEAQYGLHHIVDEDGNAFFHPHQAA